MAEKTIKLILVAERQHCYLSFYKLILFIEFYVSYHKFLSALRNSKYGLRLSNKSQ